jgi:regulatory protein
MRELNAADPLPAALRLLAVRDRSEAELRSRLARRGFAAEAVEAALERCRQLGYLDDVRFARERARALLAAGRAVGPRLLADLHAHGIEESEARAALAEAEAEIDPGRLLAELAARRFADFDYHSADARQRRRVVHYFLRRGFPLSRVLSFFQQER